MNDMNQKTYFRIPQAILKIDITVKIGLSHDAPRRVFESSLTLCPKRGILCCLVLTNAHAACNLRGGEQCCVRCEFVAGRWPDVGTQSCSCSASGR